MTGFVIQGHIYEDCDRYKDTHQIKVGKLKLNGHSMNSVTAVTLYIF